MHAFNLYESDYHRDYHLRKISTKINGIWINIYIMKSNKNEIACSHIIECTVTDASERRSTQEA